MKKLNNKGFGSTEMLLLMGALLIALFVATYLIDILCGGILV